MKNAKKHIALFLSSILFFSLNIKANANDKPINPINYDIPKKYSYENQNIAVSGTYPVIHNLKDKIFQDDINKEISNTISKMINIIKDKEPKKINIAYDIFSDKNILSIVLYFKNVISSEEEIKSINANISTLQKVSLENFFGNNAIAYANKVILNKSNELGLKSTKVTPDTPFYVKNGKIFILYGAGSVTFAQKGNISIEIDTKNIINYTISKNDYYTKSSYNVKMVPLREPLEKLGYKVTWNDKTNSISIQSENNNFISYLKPNENKYSKGSFVARPLEFPPENKDGITYVPISFFSDIVGLLYSMDSSDNIVISKYFI